MGLTIPCGDRFAAATASRGGDGTFPPGQHHPIQCISKLRKTPPSTTTPTVSRGSAIRLNITSRRFWKIAGPFNVSTNLFVR